MAPVVSICLVANIPATGFVCFLKPENLWQVFGGDVEGWTGRMVELEAMSVTPGHVNLFQETL